MGDAVPPDVRAALVALRRAAGARVTRCPDEPGTVAVRLTLADAPPAAAAYDVPSPVAVVNVRVPLDAPPTVAAVTGALPAAARDALREALNAALAAAATPAAGLAALPAAAAAAVLPAVAPFAEPYECADAAGRTVRRFALPCDEAAVVIEPSSARAPAPPPPPRPAERAADVELRWLARRFGAALHVDNPNDDAPLSFAVAFTPADPAWPRAAGPVSLRGTVDPAAYPAAGAFTLAPAAVASAAGAAVAAALAEVVSDAAGDARGIRSVLKSIDARGAEMWAAAAATAAKPTPAAAPAGPRFRLRLLGLALDGVDALTPVTLALAAACGRCGGAVDVTVDASTAAGGWPAGATACPRCATPAQLALSPSIAHAHGNTLATVVAGGATPCTPRDLLPSTLSAQCGSCGALFAVRGATPGAWLGRGAGCAGCGGRARARYEGVALEAVETAAPAPPRASLPRTARAQPPPSTTDPRRAAPAPGRPLPDRGACRHYRHSRRHFRFPCCGRIYPCDLCHETAEEHDLKLATRHLCGGCGLEQPIKPDCVACGLNLTGSSSRASATRHWEGGRGCRDKARLDPRDAAKWRGRNKTESRKSERVGAEGKARREGG